MRILCVVLVLIMITCLMPMPAMAFHGPSDTRCASCHTPHSAKSSTVPLWNGAATKSTFTLYSSKTIDAVMGQPDGSAKLCFSCHDPRLAVVSKTMNLTGFRNGDMNLHSVHVNQKTKGRTCRACHETHAIKQENYIRDSVPFGDWMLPIGFTKTATGGSCAPGCHKRFSYDRQNPEEKGQRPETPPGDGKEGIQGEKR